MRAMSAVRCTVLRWASPRPAHSRPTLRPYCSWTSQAHLSADIRGTPGPQLHQLGVQACQLAVLPAPEVALLLAILWRKRGLDIRVSTNAHLKRALQLIAHTPQTRSQLTLP